MGAGLSAVRADLFFSFRIISFLSQINTLERERERLVVEPQDRI